MREPPFRDAATVGPSIQATSALVFRTYADRTEDQALSAAFGQLAERLVDAALTNAAAPAR